jgi:flagellar L-ring protein precursor FlgH
MQKKTALVMSLCLGVGGCAPHPPADPYVPSMRFAGGALPSSSAHGMIWKAGIVEEVAANGKAQMKMVTTPEDMPGLRPVIQKDTSPTVTQAQMVGGPEDLGGDVKVIRSTEQLPRAYTGPLELGDPGVGASLWRETRMGNEVYRDFRAWQPMDLLTIIINEVSIGRHDADTEVKSKSEYFAAIENFLGLEEQTQQWNHPPDLSSLIKAQTKDDFKGEGQTNRQAQLTARMSAVVAEVLPSGLLRIEGEKIISVNNEEQVMVISGLVRPRDITSDNEVVSTKIAQIRIDYYGKGTVGEAQYGGWLGRILRIIWPF